MAKVAIVEGVTIVLYANEHPPPHFHAKFAEFKLSLMSNRFSIIKG